MMRSNSPEHPGWSSIGRGTNAVQANRSNNPPLVSKPRIYLSSPHMGGEELGLVQDAFATNWIAPLGPHVDAFEREFAAAVGSGHASALSS